jgi:hypothetical protein
MCDPQGDAVDHMNVDKVRFMNEFVMPCVFEEGCAHLQLVTRLELAGFFEVTIHAEFPS